MRLALARAQMIGHKGIILVGDPEHYARFGFTADKTTGLVMPGPVDRRRFLALELEHGVLDGVEGNIVATGQPVAKVKIAA
jgi:predicted N-acetyltransferase YhbS